MRIVMATLILAACGNGTLDADANPPPDATGYCELETIATDCPTNPSGIGADAAWSGQWSVILELDTGAEPCFFGPLSMQVCLRVGDPVERVRLFGDADPGITHTTTGTGGDVVVFARTDVFSSAGEPFSICDLTWNRATDTGRVRIAGCDCDATYRIVQANRDYVESCPDFQSQ